MHAELNRIEVLRMIHANPYQKFILSMIGGERIIIEHPENIAFDPTPAAERISTSLVGKFDILGRLKGFPASLHSISYLHQMAQLVIKG